MTKPLTKQPGTKPPATMPPTTMPFAAAPLPTAPLPPMPPPTVPLPSTPAPAMPFGPAGADPSAPTEPISPAADPLPPAEPTRVGKHSLPAEEKATGRHPVDAMTMLLPAFITGKKEKEQPHTEPAPAQSQSQKLPSSERGMLIFVAALLALGTVAVVAMLGFGGLTSHHPPAAPTTDPTPAAGAVAIVSPSDSPSPSPSPSPSDSPSPSPSPTRRPPSTRKPSPTPAAMLLGGVDTNALNSYCTSAFRGSRPQAPNQDHAGWTCVDFRGTVRANFTPDQVCASWYHQTTAHAVVGSLSDPATWKCYK